MRTTEPVDTLGGAMKLSFFTTLLIIFLLHFVNFPKVRSTTNDVIIEFISMCYSCQLGTWKSVERMEVETIAASQGKVKSTKAK